MKKLVIISLLMMNIFVYPITEKQRKIGTALMLIGGTGLAAANSKEFMPIFGVSVLASAVTYKYLYGFTPKARLDKASEILENCGTSDLVRRPFKNRDGDKETETFLDTLNRKYCKAKLPLIDASMDLKNSSEYLACADGLVKQAQQDIDKENEKELHERSIDAYKIYFAYNNNTEEALVIIKNHKKYEKQLKLYNKLDITQRQTAAKEKIADAEKKKADAQTKVADVKESSNFLEWLKWFISVVFKK